MIKKGFALVEIIVSIAISSVVSMVLFTILIQVQKSAQYVASDVSIGLQVLTGYERLQKDFTGMFWPQFRPVSVKSAKSMKQAALNNITPEENTTSNQLAQKDDRKLAAPAGPEIAKIIFSENTRFDDLEILKECSFITSNPLQVYGETKPRVARVIYSLEPELNSIAGSFVLYRQEGASLDYSQVKQASVKFALISGIRALNLNYFYQELALAQDENAVPDLIRKQELALDQMSNLEKNGDQDNPVQSLAGRVPSYVQINLSLWTNAEQKDFQDFEFWFYINNLVVEQPDTEQKNKQVDRKVNLK